MKERRQKKGSLQNGFIIALLCSVALAFLFPSPGARGGRMHICGLLADYFSTNNPKLAVGEASLSGQAESCG
jgi:hypothetical protein